MAVPSNQQASRKVSKLAFRWFRKLSGRSPYDVILDIFRREAPEVDPDDLEMDAETLLGSIQGIFTKKVKAAIGRIESKSRPGKRKFRTKSKDSTWSEHDPRGYRDIHYYYEVEYPSRVTWAVNVGLDPRKVVGDPTLRGGYRYLEVSSKVAEKAVKAAMSVMDSADFIQEAASEFSGRDVYLPSDGLEEDISDYVWDEAWEEYVVTEDGVEDEYAGVTPRNIVTNIRANRTVLPHPSKFGFRLEYDFRVSVDIRGWGD